MSIGDIDPGTPVGTDLVSSGDDQIRALKGDIQESFPNFGASPAAVTKTEAEIDDTPEKSQAETIGGSWTFSQRINADNGMTVPNDKAISGETTTVQLRQLARITPANVIELGDAVMPLELIGTSIDSVGDLNVQGSVTVDAASFLQFENLRTTPKSNLTPNQLNVGIPIYNTAGTFQGYLQLFDGTAPP